MDDISIDLLDKLKDEFNKLYFKNPNIRNYLQQLEKGIATYKEANEYSIEVGEVLSNTFKIIESNMLPDERMYFNIAQKTIVPALENNFNLISDYCVKTQQILNEAAGLHIKSIPPKINKDRIDGLVNIVSGYEKFDDAKYMLDEPIVNFSQSIVDDSIKMNADFHYKSGLQAQIIRTSTGKCCDWCLNLVGIYKYEDVKNIGNNVFRRHKSCRCEILYKPATGKLQNVHTKKLIDLEEIKKRKEFNITKFEVNGKANIVVESLKNGDILDKINTDKHSRHLIDSTEHIYGRSYVYGDIKNAEELYEKLKGSGEPVFNRHVNWVNKERVVNDSPIGKCVDLSGE